MLVGRVYSSVLVCLHHARSWSPIVPTIVPVYCCAAAALKLFDVMSFGLDFEWMIGVLVCHVDYAAHQAPLSAAPVHRYRCTSIHPLSARNRESLGCRL